MKSIQDLENEIQELLSIREALLEVTCEIDEDAKLWQNHSHIGFDFYSQEAGASFRISITQL